MISSYRRSNDWALRNVVRSLDLRLDAFRAFSWKPIKESAPRKRRIISLHSAFSYPFPADKSFTAHSMSHRYCDSTPVKENLQLTSAQVPYSTNQRLKKKYHLSAPKMWPKDQCRTMTRMLNATLFVNFDDLTCQLIIGLNQWIHTEWWLKIGNGR